MAYEMGCKEVLQFPRNTKDGFVHLLRISTRTSRIPSSTFGGGFIYSMADDKGLYWIACCFGCSQSRSRCTIPFTKSQTSP